MAALMRYWKPIAAVLLVLALMGGMAAKKREGISIGRAQVQLEWDAGKAAAAASAASAEQQHRATERALAAKIERARDETNRATESRNKVAAALAAERSRVHDDVAAYARGASGSGAAGDSFLACLGRANALGGLLDQALRASEDCAVSGERDAAIARGLFAAWPTTAEGLK